MSDRAFKDENYIPSILGVSNGDGTTPVSIYADPTTHRIFAQVTISGGIGGHGTVGDGTATVTTAGTRVQLSDVTCSSVTIQAHESNSGTIVVGGATVVAALSGRRGAALPPTASITMSVSNLNLLYIDSTTSGDKVNYIYSV